MIFDIARPKNFNSIIFIFLFITIVISWIYTIFGVGMDMSAWRMTLIEYNYLSSNSNTSAMHKMNNEMNIFTFHYFTSLFFMWSFMMFAMMLPSAFPVFVMYNKIYIERTKKNLSLLNPIIFILGYLLIWTVFSFLATLLQIFLLHINSFNLMSFKTSQFISSSIFILAGIYQFTFLKNICLYYCRNPIDILSNINFDSYNNQFLVSIRHALFCLGCCWALMLILFSVGVMNLLWITFISFYIFCEKIVNKSKTLDIAIGFLLIFLGIKNYLT